MVREFYPCISPLCSIILFHFVSHSVSHSVFHSVSPSVFSILSYHFCFTNVIYHNYHYFFVYRFSIEEIRAIIVPNRVYTGLFF